MGANQFCLSLNNIHHCLTQSIPVLQSRNAVLSLPIFSTTEESHKSPCSCQSCESVSQITLTVKTLVMGQETEMGWIWTPSQRADQFEAR